MNVVIKHLDLEAGKTLEIVQGDICEEWVDAIVNAANAHLNHGGGVAGTIARRGGPSIQQESDEWIHKHGPITHSSPAYTGGGKLPCRFVIHAVGPIWGQGDEDQKLADAVRGSLQMAEQLGLKSIALPAISTGIFGFPKERAARIILNSILKSLSSETYIHLNLVRMVLYDAPSAELFAQTLDTSTATS